ncbi:MAG: CPBP family intramembrane metalloprotease [Thermomicrobia bacterium]|nr:CPBP family intramembrane metalloprotease [Thermomicrobia bacterium]
MTTQRRTPLLWASYCGYLVAIVAIELVTTFLSPAVGVGAQLILITALLIDASCARREERALLVALLFAPLIRVVSLALPLAKLPVVSWSLTISVPLGVAVIVAAWILGLSRDDLGLRRSRALPQIGIGLLGIPFGVISYLILRPASLVATLDWQMLIVPALILLVSTGLLEELIFRGMLQSAVETMLGRWGIVYSSAVFAALQIGNRSPLLIAYAFLVGLVFALSVRRTHSIIGTTIAHGLMSIGAYLIFPHLIGGRSF